MPSIWPQQLTPPTDFEPHDPEGARTARSSTRSVPNCHSFKYVPNECFALLIGIVTAYIALTQLAKRRYIARHGELL